MFCPLAYRDIVLIGRGLLILVVAITIGISVVEQQLYSLTQRQECVQIFDMNRDNNGLYSLSVIGYSYSVSAVYPVAEIRNGDKEIIIKTSVCTLFIPKTLQFNCRKELAWLAVQVTWLKQFAIEIREKINVYVQ